MADKTNRFDAITDRINWNMQNAGGSALGGMMGLFGIPWQQKRGGQWMTINPNSQSIYLRGTTNPRPYRKNKPENPTTPPPPQPTAQWSFPQYASTWAFTPPQPLPVPLPPGNPFKK